MMITEYSKVSVNGRGGTIVHVYQNGEAYEVEFDDNRVETVEAKNITEVLYNYENGD